MSKIKSIGITNCHIRLRTKKKMSEISVNASSYDDFMDMVRIHSPDDCMNYKIKLADVS